LQGEAEEVVGVRCEVGVEEGEFPRDHFIFEVG
jgi:hypothetical protein